MARARSALSGERRLIAWLAIALVVCVLLYLLRAALMPFVAGMAVAYLFDPLADRLERLGLPRALAAGLIVAAFLVLFATLLVLLLPLLTAQVAAFIGRLPGYFALIEEAIAPALVALEARLGAAQMQRLDTVFDQFAADVVTWAGGLFARVLRGGAAVVNLIGLAVITPVVAFYLLRDWDRPVARIDFLLPRRGGDAIRAIAREIDQRLAGFVRGQGLVCLLLASWYAVALVVIGLDFGLLLGLFAGLISAIPYLGNVVGLGVGLGLAFAQFDGWREPVLVAAVFGLGQLVEGYVLQPKIVGNRVGLHPVWLLFAVIAGGALLGLTGTLLAVPVAAVIGVLLRFAIARYLQSPLYLDAPRDAAAVTGEPPPAP